ncbi:MAG: DNA recombination protein RmuC [Bdellovibrionales bacterium]|nr:DNA recombination protein RmuC [Bdellovibrionales bacterium]
MEFEKLTQNLLEEKAKIYKTRSEESLNAILSPLKTKIMDFQKQVADCYEREGRERHSLEATVKELQKAHQNALQETARLTEALKGSSKVQGDWGEVVLERILEDSGLRKDEEFILQGKGLELKTDEGNRLKPDVVVRLPEERHIVIDSKVSLIHYHEYMKANTQEEKEKWAGQMIQALSQHINSLSEKSYSVSDKLIAPDFTFMFIPLEGVFSLVLHLEQALFEKAWNKHIVIVTPTTLLASLRTVASIWKMDRQNKNAKKIASESGKMYDKLVGFVNDMKNIGRGLEMAEKSYTEAFNKLKHGRGNLLGRAEKIKKLGAASSKDLSLEVQPNSEEA